MPAELKPYLDALMLPDEDRLAEWMDAYFRAPEVHLDKSIEQQLMAAEDADLPTSINLLDYLLYDPIQRNQNPCGNCWVWTGTGLLELALSVENGIKNRLSVQYFNSCRSFPPYTYACCGGWLNKFAEWYRAVGWSIPWSNVNADWQDRADGRICEDGASLVGCGSINTAVRYPISFIQDVTVPTFAVGQAAAVSNIKNVLNQRRGVWFSWFLENRARWTDFGNFWAFDTEADLWDPDVHCAPVAWVPDEGAGHAVLIVGYNEDDPLPANHYWLALNSWGTEAGRPNGLFRIPMYFNYDCLFQDLYGNLYPRFTFMALDVSFDAWCTYALSDGDAQPGLSNLLNASGDWGIVNLLLSEHTVHPAGCTWEAESSASWLTFLGDDHGTGEQSFLYQVAPKPTYERRIATLKAAGRIYFVQQAGNPPARPAGVTATDGAFIGKVRVSWNATPGADDYKVYRASSGQIYAEKGQTADTVFEDVNVQANVVYSYAVVAVNDFGESPTSAADMGYAAELVLFPEAPTGLAATNGTYNDRVRVTWGEAKGAWSYNVYRKLNTSGLVFFGKIGETTTTTYDDFTAELGKRYLYKVHGVNGLGEGTASNTDEGFRTLPVLPPTPTEVTASDGVYTDKVRITWSGSGPPYTVYRAPKSDGIVFFAPIGEATTETYDDTTAEPGKVYTYKVTARNWFGESAFSQGDDGYALARLYLPAPTTVKASEGTYADRVQVQWSAVGGALSYQVHRAPVSNYLVFYELIGTTDRTSYDDMTAALGTTYNYSVRTVNFFGPGRYSLPDKGWRDDSGYCYGDSDKDLDVDGQDLARFAAEVGRDDCCESNAAPCTGDFDRSCAVDDLDLAVFAEKFGKTGCPQ